MTLNPGDKKSYDYKYTAVKAGAFRFSSTAQAQDANNTAVPQATAQRSGAVSSILVTMTVNPATIVQDEDKDGPKPVDATLTITVKNITGDLVSSVNLRSLNAERTKAGDLLAISQVSGPEPDSISGFPLKDLAPGGTQVVTAVFRATDDGITEFNALVTGASPDGATLSGFGTTKLTVSPKYLLEFTSHIASSGDNGTLLPAGSNIKIAGIVHNLSDTATLDLGPLYAEVSGNAGLQGLSYTTTPVDPRDLVVPGDLTLDPGETKDFILQVSTSYSDPIGKGEVGPSGGTRAEVTFTPWGTAKNEDDTTQDITPALILTTSDDLDRKVSIDDSIPIPEKNWGVVAGAMSVGAIQGVWNAATGTLWGLVALAKLPYTTLRAATEFQAQVWASFDSSEKDAFAQDTGLLVAAIPRPQRHAW